MQTLTTPQVSNGRWTSLEHQQFLLGLHLYAKNWKKIEQVIRTRNGSQIRSHAQKFFLKVKSKPADFPQELHKYALTDVDQTFQIDTEEISAAEKNSSIDHETDSSFLCWQLNQYSKEVSKVITFNKTQFNFWEQCIEIKKDISEIRKTAPATVENSEIQQFVSKPCNAKNTNSFVPYNIQQDNEVYEKLRKIRKL